MSPQEVVVELAKRFPGRFNDLPTPMRKGTRVAIPFGDEVAYGTLRGSYGTGSDATSLVVLDGTGAVVDVPWSMMRRPERTR